jgi:hypothetical protein
MLDVITLLIGLAFYVVSMAICWKAHVWRRAWANPALKWIALSSAAARAGLFFFVKNDVSVSEMNHPAIAHFFVTLAAVFGFFSWGVFVWPLLGAALWLGETTLCPVEGKYSSRFLAIHCRNCAIGDCFHRSYFAFKRAFRVARTSTMVFQIYASA